MLQATQACTKAAFLDLISTNPYLIPMQKLEEQLAHLTHTVEELSDVVARQDTEIQILKRRVQMLLEREADRESAGSGGVVMGDERPPHY